MTTFQPINFNKCDDDNDKDNESNDENKAEDDYVVMVTNLDYIFFGGIKIIR